jgi:hypothetical protein
MFTRPVMTTRAELLPRTGEMLSGRQRLVRVGRSRAQVGQLPDQCALARSAASTRAAAQLRLSKRA